MSDLDRRIAMRFDAWLDDTAERDIPAATFGRGVRADYREVLAATTEAQVARLGIVMGEGLATVATALLKVGNAVLDKTGAGRG